MASELIPDAAGFVWLTLAVIVGIWWLRGRRLGVVDKFPPLPRAVGTEVAFAKPDLLDKNCATDVQRPEKTLRHGRISRQDGLGPEVAALLAEVDATVRASKRLCVAYQERRNQWQQLDAELAAKSRQNLDESRALITRVGALVSAVCYATPPLGTT
jgi:hypothetical protein